MDETRTARANERTSEEAAVAYRLSRPPFRILCAAGVPRAVAEKWLAEHASWFTGDGAPARRLLTVELPPRTATAKPEHVPLGRSIRYALSARPARSLRAFRLGTALARAGIHAPRPLAVIERRERGLGLVRRSCLIMETIEGDSLREYLAARLGTDGAGGTDWKAPLWTAIAREVARLHAAGFRQRDLKAANVVVAEGSAGPEVHLVDLEAMSRLRAPPPPRVRQRDLARLLVSLRAARAGAPQHPGAPGEDDWRALVRSYLTEAAGRPPRDDELKAYLRATAQWAERKERRNRRRRRPLA